MARDLDAKFKSASADILHKNKIIAEIRALLIRMDTSRDTSRTLTQFVDRIDQIVNKSNTLLLSEKDFENKILFIWWDVSKIDAFVFALLDFDNEHPRDRIAQGCKLGKSTLQLDEETGHEERIGFWKLFKNRIIIEQTFPSRDLVIEVNLNRSMSEGTWTVTRTNGNITETGIAMLFEIPTKW